ncbi:MAG: sulfite exporter TauE/SafE family protein [Polynucleobacter sp.]|uniref:sulfite exporter TauE/SafE family protein n=1 Tax=Polynucleobacter sp. TaxID=2029855 RepID=UPI002716E057|nr:sulfite exporter TauE/SafE family protein [Polynucleobacter sp.]MDO8713464.1 sulfite exporter TauE/SafE family protein [Polynucleobacter sp.]
MFGAYFIFGVSGFGSSIIAVPLLVQLYPLKTVVPIMVIIDICASLYMGKKFSADANFKELKWLFPFSLVGMVLGVTLLVQAPSNPLLVILGCFAALNGARVLWQRNIKPKDPINKWWAAPFGFFGGIFTALFATGGPIYASYLDLRINDPRVLRATMTFAILALTFLRLCLMLVIGLILSWPVLGLAICLMPATFVGILVGTHVHAKLSNAAMRMAYGSILLFSGTMLLVRQFS